MGEKKLRSFWLVLLSVVFVFTTCGGGGGGGGGGTGTGTATKQLGTSADDFGFGVAVGGSGNVYVTGLTGGGLDGNTNVGGADVFLVKYDSAGTKQWTRQLGTSSYDSGQGVAVDGSGNVYVTGLTGGSLDGNSNAGNWDIFLVKYDSAGTKQWTRQLGTTAEDGGYGVAVDGSGNVYVTGHTGGSLDGNTNVGGADIFLVKYDSAGTKQWTRQLGTSSYDSGQGVAVDGGGNVYVTGLTGGGLDGNSNAGNWDIFLVKYDSAGTKQWTRQLGTITYDYGYGVAVDGSGNVYVTGFTFGGLDGNTNAGGADIFLVKYDSAGTKQWARQLGTITNDYTHGVAVDSSGNIYVTGETLGGLDGNANAGNWDIFLVKYDSAGTKQWTRELGTTVDDYGYGPAVDSSGNIYVTGETRSGLDGNTNAGGGDIFLVKYDSAGVKQ